jgi:ABC-type branched-subunit amino acid transport system substrate-binding protein
LKERTSWRRSRAVSSSTVAFAVIITCLVALVGYANYVDQQNPLHPCVVAGTAGPSNSDVNIGFVTEISGSAVSDGYAARIAAELAVNQTNAAGGIDGKKLGLVVLDSQTSPQQARQCASAADQQDGVLAVTGPTDLGDALAVQTYAEAHALPFVVAGVSSALLNAPGLNWTVNVQPDAVQWGAAVAKYVASAVPGAKIALMTQNAEQQKEMAAGIRWYAQAFGNESIVFDQVYANAQFPWATAAAAVKASGANLVLISWVSGSGFSESNVIEALLSAGLNQDQLVVVSGTGQVSDLGSAGTGIRGGALFDSQMAQGYANATGFVDQLQPFVNGALQSPEYCGVCPTDIGPVYYYSYVGMEMMISSIRQVLSGGQALTRDSFMASMKHATIEDAFGNALTVGTTAPPRGSFYIVQAGQLNATANTYPLKVITTVQFAPGTVPAYRLAKSGA